MAAANEPDLEAAVRFDFTDETTWAAALDDVDRVFLLRPPPLSDVKRYIRPFIAELERRGIRHVVFLSLMGVNRAMPHWQVEQDLKATSMGSTMLRPSFFMQNLTGPYRNDICANDAITQPAGRGAFSFVDAADLAEAAAFVLQHPRSHLGAAYTLTGAHAYRYDEVASMLSAALGRPITYQPGRAPNTGLVARFPSTAVEPQSHGQPVLGCGIPSVGMQWATGRAKARRRYVCADAHAGRPAARMGLHEVAGSPLVSGGCRGGVRIRG